MIPKFYKVNVDSKTFTISEKFLKEYEDTLLSKSLLTMQDIPGLIHHENGQVYITDIDGSLFRILLSNMRTHAYYEINEVTDDSLLDSLYQLAKLFNVVRIIEIIDELKNNMNSSNKGGNNSDYDSDNNNDNNNTDILNTFSEPEIILEPEEEEEIEPEINSEDEDNLYEYQWKNGSTNGVISGGVNIPATESVKEQLHQILDDNNSPYNTDISDYDTDDENEEPLIHDYRYDINYDNSHDTNNTDIENSLTSKLLNYENIDFYSLMTSKDPIDQENFRKIMEANLKDPVASTAFMIRFSTDPNVKKYLESLAYQNDNPDVVSSDYSSIDEGSIHLESDNESNDDVNKYEDEYGISDIQSDDNNEMEIEIITHKTEQKSEVPINPLVNKSPISLESKNLKLTRTENLNVEPYDDVNSQSTIKSNKSNISYRSTTKIMKGKEGKAIVKKVNTKYIQL